MKDKTKKQTKKTPSNISRDAINAAAGTLKDAKGTQLESFASGFSKGHADPLYPFSTHPPRMSLEALLHETSIKRIAELYPTP